MSADDTIAAIATPPGEGAIALVRVSGAGAVAVVQSLFEPDGVARDPGCQRLGRIVHDGRAIDQVIIVVNRAPRSFTGEDVVEISCHGGVLVTHSVLDAVLASGARLAGPGEFTQRAFLNGKIDLTRAEAVMDVIRAQTSLALRSANEQLSGRLGERILALRAQLLGALAHLEAYVDFPDEDISPDSGAALAARVGVVLGGIRALLATADHGRILREGVRTVLIGQPNVGKSSLLNLLLGHDRAIVHELPGTTRDTIEEVVNMRGLPLRLVDTAGLHDSGGVVEREGMARTRRMLEVADLALHVVDGSLARPAGWCRLGIEGELLVLNKADLGRHPDWAGEHGVWISCRTNEGIDRLEEAVFGMLTGGGAALGESAVAINARHKACLARALRHGEDALKALLDGVAPEFVAVDLRAAMEAVGDVVGRADTEELLGEIFSSFCIGK